MKNFKPLDNRKTDVEKFVLIKSVSSKSKTIISIIIA